MTDEYVELHARSAFSFLEGACVPEELVSACSRMDSSAMALLDRDGVYSAARFHMAAKKCGLRAHIGAELTVDFGTAGNPIHVSVPLLVKTRKGYQNLCRLITLIKMRVPKNTPCAATPDELAEYADGLICLTGDRRGPLAHALHSSTWHESLHNPLIRRRDADPIVLVEWLLETFGRGNVYAELQRHLIREEEWRNQATVDIASKLKVPLLATNGACYSTRDQRQVLDVFTCLRNHVRLDEAGRLLARNSERNFKTPAVMKKLFADLPQAIANTIELSSSLTFALDDLGYEFPRYPVDESETMDSFLRKQTYEGARGRYDGRIGRPSYERAREQIDRELALIAKLKLAGYFLIVWDIVEFCRKQGILVQGRGSAANSAVCYSLGITAVDPVGMELLFERFLSEERGEWPDIDLDLPSGDRRERVIQYVYETYGKAGSAMTANVITYRGRSAVREVGKVMNFDEPTLAKLSSLVSGWEWKDPNYKAEHQFRDAGLDLNSPRISKFLELYKLVQDLPRHLGQHSGGLVVCQGQLDSVVPLEPASMPGRVVIQWDKEDCADMGIVKVDLLGLGMMAVLEDSLELIRDAYGENVELAHIPYDDAEVYAGLQKADTIGLFQVESRAQMSCLPRMRPVKFYDLVVQVAIIRPGPIVGNMVNPYIRRRMGRETPDPLHPSLEPVLKRTLGIPLFQEQLLRIAMTCAGFTGGEAEELRRALGFKRSVQRMKEIEIKLRTGMERTGITGKTQDMIVQSISSFALYGFPESHAASFALIAYASAYLKCHYLAAFTAAILNNQPMGFYSPFTLVKDAQRHGLKVLPVDITRSDWPCTIENVDNALCLRLGLNYVKGLRELAGQAIVRERTAGSFLSIQDLSYRVPKLRKNEVRALASVGALNHIGDASSSTGSSHRRDALWKAEHASREAGELYRELPEDGHQSPLNRMTLDERINADLRGTGITVGRHPIAHHRAELNDLNVIRAVDLARVADGSYVRVAGWVIVRQRPGTAKGFMFISMEDETGVSNAIVTPDMFDRNRITITQNPFLLIEGILQNQDGVVSIRARRIQALEFHVGASVSHDFH
ncbi:MAG: error-prone polymerase [Blastocatellia bacterium]|jgi:error-prone DNA polymerase|nr:error-prone polymerase [Blastocatellia bacterium]